MVFRLNAAPQKSTREHITETLRNAILAGELPSGQRLVERELADQLGTSRAPVREALMQLEQEGFVESLPYRGTRVTTTTAIEVREVLLPIRTQLEIFALRQLLKNKNEEVISALISIVKDMRTATANEDHFGVIEKDLEFHRVLMETTGYSHPIRIWQSITPVILRAFLVGTTTRTLNETVEGHEKLLEVMQSGDAEAAEVILRHHIEEMAYKFMLEEHALTEEQP